MALIYISLHLILLGGCGLVMGVGDHLAADDTTNDSSGQAGIGSLLQSLDTFDAVFMLSGLLRETLDFGGITVGGSLAGSDDGNDQMDSSLGLTTRGEEIEATPEDVALSTENLRHGDHGVTNWAVS